MSEKGSNWWFLGVGGLIVIILSYFVIILKPIWEKKYYALENWEMYALPVTAPLEEIPLEISDHEAFQKLDYILTITLGRIAERYPIEVIRKEFQKAAKNIGEKQEIRYKQSGKIQGQTLAIGSGNNGNPLIVFFVPAWQELVAEAKRKGLSDEEANNLLDDYLIITTCHTYFHFHEQKYWAKKHLTIDEAAKCEAECWGYTIEKVIIPMLENGRGSNEGGIFSLAALYQISGYTRFSPEWIRFMKGILLKKYHAVAI